MANIDFQHIESSVATLAATLGQQYAQSALTDGQKFLQQQRDNVIKLTQDRAAGRADPTGAAGISELEYQQGLMEVRAAAKMEALKQAGLAQVKIDSFINGVIDIVEKAAIAAI